MISTVLDMVENIVEKGENLEDPLFQGCYKQTDEV